MISATDITNFLACHHLTALDQAETAGEIRKPFFPDPGIELLKKLGLQHERSYLDKLKANQDAPLIEIPGDIPWDEAVARTREAMHRGVYVIYQATLQETLWGGRADFLVRVDQPSALGRWSYEVVETKLARSAKARALIQLCCYSDILSRIQGLEPLWMHVVLGGGRGPENFRVQQYIAYFRKIRSEFDEAWKAPTATYPEPVENCNVCSWFPVCDTRRRADDHLSLVAGISRHQRKVLVDREVTTVARLAMMPLPSKRKIEGIGDTALLRIREQARLQFQGRQEGRLIHELLQPVVAEKGLAALPAPSRGDMFLDLEGDPYAHDQELEYLFGIVTLDRKSHDPVYEALWSFDSAAEKKAFEKFVADVMKRCKRYPDMHIYHYAPYEPTAIKRMAGQHGTCVEAVDQLLRAGIFVDLYRVITQGLRASVESYSIKKLEPLYGYTRALPLRRAVLALQAFESVLAFGTGQEAPSELLAAIESYNRDDCVSAWRLREWLEDRRRELEAKTGEAVPHPALKSGDPGEGLASQLEEAAAVMARLIDGLPSDESEWTNEQRARWLLAQMLEWHRREDKSAWWEYYRLCELTDDGLVEDKSALGGLVYVGEVGKFKKSLIYRHRFPLQDYTIDRALDVRDPRTQKGVGEIVAIDGRNLTIDIRRGASSSVPHPTALIPFEIVNSKVLRDSLLCLGTWVAEHGISGPGPFQAARDLLLRHPPKVLAGTNEPLIGENQQLTPGAKRLVRSSSRQPAVLPIQGPPGSGKTYTGARMAVELVKQGRRVGITAVSHKVISNLLGEMSRAARQAGVRLRIVQKANETDGSPESIVEQVDGNQEVLDALTSGGAQVAAGTAWLWSRGEMANSVDVLFVDEAGQMSLANVLAVSRAARSVVLLGDPQQLDQPQRGVHPPGVDVSALAHLLNGHATIGPDQGLFLTETWRLHPEICAFTSELFYDRRLAARPENQKQRLNARGSLGGAGLRFVPVEHSGNQNESPEEVERIAGMVRGLLRGGVTWTSKKGKKATLELADILIVAPYNAQVSALSRRLPAGARVGTVDKFQGQEAPVVFYSMATSTPEDAPRGMEFLYSLNRFNVAISRAQCVAVLVASPALFQVQCKTPHQIELANAFCRYVEMATDIG